MLKIGVADNNNNIPASNVDITEQPQAGQNSSGIFDPKRGAFKFSFNITFSLRYISESDAFDATFKIKLLWLLKSRLAIDNHFTH